MASAQASPAPTTAAVASGSGSLVSTGNLNALPAASNPSGDSSALLAEILARIRQSAFFMHKALDAERPVDALKCALEIASELRTTLLPPKKYYELFMASFNALRHLTISLRPIHSKFPLPNLYEVVQYSQFVLPRCYLMICVATAYLHHLPSEEPQKSALASSPQSRASSPGAATPSPPNSTSASPPPKMAASPKAFEKNERPLSTAEIVISDLFNMCAGVQRPVHALFLRHFLACSLREYLETHHRDPVAVELSGFVEMNRHWVRLQHMGTLAQRDLRTAERRELCSLVGGALMRVCALLPEENSTQVKQLNASKRKVERSFKEHVLPAILHHVCICNDPLAQEYILDAVISAFPDVFLHSTVDQLLAATAELHPLVPVSSVIRALIDRLRPAIIASAAGRQNSIKSDDVSFIPSADLLPRLWSSVNLAVEARPDIAADDIAALILSIFRLVVSVCPDNLAFIVEMLTFASALTKSSSLSSMSSSSDASSKTASIQRATSDILELLLIAVGVELSEPNGAQVTVTERLAQYLASLQTQTLVQPQTHSQAPNQLMQPQNPSIPPEGSPEPMPQEKRRSRLLSLFGLPNGAASIRDIAKALPRAEQYIFASAFVDMLIHSNSIVSTEAALLGILNVLLALNENVALDSHIKGEDGPKKLASFLFLIYNDDPKLHSHLLSRARQLLLEYHSTNIRVVFPALVHQAIRIIDRIRTSLSLSIVSSNLQEMEINSSNSKSADISAATNSALSSAASANAAAANSQNSPPSSADRRAPALMQLLADSGTPNEVLRQSEIVPHFRFISSLITTIQIRGEDPYCAALICLEVAACADRAHADSLIYEFFALAMSIYEESLGAAKLQSAFLKHLCNALLLTSIRTTATNKDDGVSASQDTFGLSVENYSTIAERCVTYAAQMLSRVEQSRMIALCTHLFWRPQFQRESRVGELLQRSLRVAELCLNPLHTLSLQVELVETYLHFFDIECPSVPSKHLSAILDLVASGISARRVEENSIYSGGDGFSHAPGSPAAERFSINSSPHAQGSIDPSRSSEDAAMHNFTHIVGIFNRTCDAIQMRKTLENDTPQSGRRPKYTEIFIPSFY